MSPNSTCRFLSNGYRFELKADNKVRCTPCCKWDNAKSIPIDHHPIFHKRYREEIKNADAYTYPGCHICNELEAQGIPATMRNSSFNDIPEDSESGDATFLEIQLDRTCNGGCIVCGPHFSSYWQQELRTAGIPVMDNTKEDHLGKICKIVDIQKARKINFLGGESFLTDEDTRLLKDIKNPELVTLQYSTNGSVHPSKQRQQLWTNFKRVNISFSIDGVNDRFDYIRYPLKWKKVSDNFLKFQDELPKNVVFSVCHTVNIFNLYYYDEFKNWYDTTGLPERRLSYNPAFGLLSPYSVSEKLHERIVEKYGKDHKVTRTINNTELNPTELLEFMDGIDYRRNLNWRDVFPEIGDCL